jgi:type IV pilus assembly protein PilN
MANINLLPWREELREEKKRNFLMSLLLVLICAGGVLLLIDRGYNFLINNQNDRNNYLTSEISKLDAQINEIRELQRQKDELASRMAIIQDLQGSRPVIVHVLDQTARTIPDLVYYTRIERINNDLIFEGVAESYPLVSELMVEMERSEWFGDSPQLSGTSEIASAADGTPRQVGFEVSTVIARPDLDEEEAE